jgi:hypothetical protein
MTGAIGYLSIALLLLGFVLGSADEADDPHGALATRA